MVFNKKFNSKDLIQYLNDRNFSGNICITDRNEILFEKSHDFAHKGFKVKNLKTTRFALASINKMFTGISVLQLVESGKCNLDDPVSSHFKNDELVNVSQITIKELLTHSSGLPDYIDENNPESFELKNNSELLTIDDYLKQIQVTSFPTSNKGSFHYNNYGYIILGKIIENLTNNSYYEYIQENIFSNANMKRSGFFQLNDTIEDIAEGYEKKQDDSWKKNIFSIPNKGASDGGAYSTTQDLSNFIQAINDNQLLSKKYTHLFLEPQIFDYQEENHLWQYGLGNWFLLKKKENEIIRWGHPGEDIGVSNRLFYYPNHHISVVILSNVTGQAGKVAWFIHEMITE